MSSGVLWWIVAIAGLYLAHRFCLYLEAHGYLYYVNSRGRRRGASALLGLASAFVPSLHHVIELQEKSENLEPEWIGDDEEPEDA